MRAFAPFLVLLIHGVCFDACMLHAFWNAQVPKGATVEITAKVAAGYHKEALDDLSARLRQPESIREQCGKIYALAQKVRTRPHSHDEKV